MPPRNSYSVNQESVTVATFFIRSRLHLNISTLVDPDDRLPAAPLVPDILLHYPTILATFSPLATLTWNCKYKVLAEPHLTK